MELLFRCDGSKEIGMGHIARCITLANATVEHLGMSFSFMCRDYPAARTLLEKAGYSLHVLSKDLTLEEEIGVVLQQVEHLHPDGVILDILDLDVNSSFMSRLRALTDFLLVITDDSNPRYSHHADLVVNGNPLQRAEFYTGQEFTRYLLGPKYFVMDPVYAELRHRPRIFPELATSIFVSMGGSDHNDLVFKGIDALELLDGKLDVLIVNGPAFGKDAEVKARVADARHQYMIRSTVDNFPELLSRADMAITAGGNTHMNRLCAGTPGVVLCQLPRQNEVATAMANRGATLNMEMGNIVSVEDLAEAIDTLIRTPELRRSMSEIGKSIVDGMGCERVLQEIRRALRQKINVERNQKNG